MKPGLIPNIMQSMQTGYEKTIAELEASKDNSYKERNQLVAALSRLYPAQIGVHPANEPWDDDWRNIVFIDTPHGQLSWHIHDSELPNFAHLSFGTAVWDGHTTEEKYARLAKCSALDLTGGFRNLTERVALRSCYCGCRAVNASDKCLSCTAKDLLDSHGEPR